MKQVRIVATAGLAILTFTTNGAAQSLGTTSPAAAIEVVTGIMDYDFQGTGKTMPVSIRASRTLTGGLSFEAGATFARPSQTFGPSTFTAPEARLVYTWRLGRISPFVAGGGGFSTTRARLTGTTWRTTLLAGGGARFDLTDRMYALGEMRLRGLSNNFSASTAEWLGGLGWRFR